MRVVFMGTPDFSVPALSAILESGHTVVAAYTRAPRQAGRGMARRPSPVHRLAEENGIDVLTPASLRDPGAADAFRAHAADVAIVVAYGLILPQPILDAPRFGCLNVHASLLPRWRGAAPIQRAIMAGDAETGVMIMQMEAGLDTGPVALTEHHPIGAEDTAGDLQDRLAASGADLVAAALQQLSEATLTFSPQSSDGVVYAHKIDKLEARIDWARPAAALHDHIRGLSPFPGAHFEADLGRGRPERVKVLRSRRIDDSTGSPGQILDSAMTVACAEGALQLETVQRAGKGPMPAAEFLRGTRLGAGTRLS